MAAVARMELADEIVCRDLEGSKQIISHFFPKGVGRYEILSSNWMPHPLCASAKFKSSVVFSKPNPLEYSKISVVVRRGKG
jgi:hypothetical protein